MYLYLTYKEADFLRSIPLFPVGHAELLSVLEQHPPLMQREACAIFFHLSPQDRTEAGSLSFLKSGTDLRLFPCFLSLTFTRTEESPRGEAVCTKTVCALEGESKHGPCYHRGAKKQQIHLNEGCMGPSMLLTGWFALFSL